MPEPARWGVQITRVATAAAIATDAEAVIDICSLSVDLDLNRGRRMAARLLLGEVVTSIVIQVALNR